MAVIRDYDIESGSTPTYVRLRAFLLQSIPAPSRHISGHSYIQVPRLVRARNLVDNPLRHGEKVSRITIYYTEEADKLKPVYKDNGIGISDDTRQNLFKEGYGKSTGYGLYLTAKLCKMYGWKI